MGSRQTMNTALKRLMTEVNYHDGSADFEGIFSVLVDHFLLPMSIHSLSLSVCHDSTSN